MCPAAVAALERIAPVRRSEGLALVAKTSHYQSCGWEGIVEQGRNGVHLGCGAPIHPTPGAGRGRWREVLHELLLKDIHQQVRRRLRGEKTVPVRQRGRIDGAQRQELLKRPGFLRRVA